MLFFMTMLMASHDVMGNTTTLFPIARVCKAIKTTTILSFILITEFCFTKSVIAEETQVLTAGAGDITTAPQQINLVIPANAVKEYGPWKPNPYEILDKDPRYSEYTRNIIWKHPSFDAGLFYPDQRYTVSCDQATIDNCYHDLITHTSYKRCHLNGIGVGDQQRVRITDLEKGPISLPGLNVVHEKKVETFCGVSDFNQLVPKGNALYIRECYKKARYEFYKDCNHQNNSPENIGFYYDDTSKTEKHDELAILNCEVHLEAGYYYPKMDVSFLSFQGDAHLKSFLKNFISWDKKKSAQSYFKEEVWEKDCSKKMITEKFRVDFSAECLGAKNIFDVFETKKEELNEVISTLILPESGKTIFMGYKCSSGFNGRVLQTLSDKTIPIHFGIDIPWTSVPACKALSGIWKSESEIKHALAQTALIGCTLEGNEYWTNIASNGAVIFVEGVVVGTVVVTGGSLLIIAGGKMKTAVVGVSALASSLASQAGEVLKGNDGGFTMDEKTGETLKKFAENQRYNN